MARWDWRASRHRSVPGRRLRRGGLLRHPSGLGSRLLSRGPFFRVRLGKIEFLLTAWLLGMGLHAVVLFTFCVAMVPPVMVFVPALAAMTRIGRRELIGLGRCW